LTEKWTNTFGPQKKILVIDDNEHLRDSLSGSLSAIGYEVVAAINGVEGYDLLLQNRFDLVITDCQMPEIDGWHLVDLIKERRPHTPVLMITGQSQDEILEKMTAGQVDFLMFKPFRMKELHHIVQSFLVNNSSKRDTTKIYKGVYSTSV
jgi:DNA-binding NtrC family response regulator